MGFPRRAVDTEGPAALPANALASALGFCCGQTTASSNNFLGNAVATATPVNHLLTTRTFYNDTSLILLNLPFCSSSSEPACQQLQFCSAIALKPLPPAIAT